MKNVFIFAPLFFAEGFTEPSLLLETFWAFIIWSLLASSIYFFNDWNDVDDDRRHPRKRYRPLAKGTITSKEALIGAFLLFLGSIGLAFLLVPQILSLLFTYFILNLAYTLRLKRMALVDVTVISLGFVLRLYVGGQVVLVSLSHWIVIITFLLALFLALAKRWDDVVLSRGNTKAMRASVAGYNETFLSMSMAMIAAIATLAYIMYTISKDVIERVGSEQLFFTAGFVLMGFLRYMQLAFVEKRSGAPTSVVLTDRLLQTIIAGWLICFGFMIYR